MQHHRRLWADELQRCQETSKELEKARDQRNRRDWGTEKKWGKFQQGKFGRKMEETVAKMMKHWRHYGKILKLLEAEQLWIFLETLGETLGYDETRIFDAS